MGKNIGYATPDKTTPLAPFTFDRRDVGPEDVRIDIAYCGVCHSDVHQARDEFGGALATLWPCLPGHEIAGTVAEVGADVTTYAVGDRVGVGCLVYWATSRSGASPRSSTRTRRRSSPTTARTPTREL